MWARGALTIALLGLLAGQTVTGASESQPLHHEPAAVPGAELEELLAIARAMSPELMARALEAEAMLARIDAEGELPDPVLRLELQDIARRDGSVLPERPGSAILRAGFQNPVARQPRGIRRP